jgi:hypothetical protein
MTTSGKESAVSVRSRIFSGLAAEVAFTMLPLLVVLIVLFERSVRLFSSPEWSFGAAILFGQSLVKFVSGLSRGGAASTGPMALAIALLVVFGLVPSLVVLTMTLQVLESHGESCLPCSPPVPLPLQVTQVVLFVLAALVYMLLGALGEMYERKFRKAGIDHNGS